MQEFFFTILSIWVVWRLFSSFSGSKTTSRTYQQRNTNSNSGFYSEPKKTEGEIRIETKASVESKIPPTEGEYVDYEEIK